MTTREKIHTILDDALEDLGSLHRPLFERNANERSLTHWLAVLLVSRFPGWDVDCEYNRDGFATKKIRIRTAVSSDDLDAQTVFPDIIVHRRGTPDNLLVIEAKKSNNRVGNLQDREKLEAFMASGMGGLSYRFGALVVFRVEEGTPLTQFELLSAADA